jgi:hypothetical protein
MPLLVTRKKQKSFIHLDRAGFGTAGPEKKNFLPPFFFKKAATFLLPSLSP